MDIPRLMDKRTCGQALGVFFLAAVVTLSVCAFKGELSSPTPPPVSVSQSHVATCGGK